MVSRTIRLAVGVAVSVTMGSGMLLGLAPMAQSVGASTTSSTPAPYTTVPASGADAAGTVWMCAPGVALNPCEANLGTTVVPAHGVAGPEIQPAPNPASGTVALSTDCFYVYPTVSRQKTDNANLRIQPAEIDIAEQQASRFSGLCNVWAPIYRQRTLVSLEKGLGADPQADLTAYQSLLAAWQDYLANYNHGRPIIFIGHSQGAAMLIRLLKSQVDPNPALRARLVSAIILGGNVTVPDGKEVGGTFDHIPACTSESRTGCVIAYSSFPSRPPADSLFGRPGQGVSLQSGQTTKKGVHVLCTNPANLSGGSGSLMPYFRLSGALPAPWVEFPDLYSAHCESSGGATWLQVTDIGGPNDKRPRVTETQGPQWGYHALDVNLSLGNLLSDVSYEIASYGNSHLPAHPT